MLRDKYQFRRILEHGWRYGNKYDPRFPGLRDLVYASLNKLDESHPIAQAMVASIQYSGGFALQEMAQDEYGRGLIVDGDAGPMTLDLIDEPRCNVPDWGPGSGTHVMEDGSLVDEMGELLMTAEDLEINPTSTGSGSWPHSCHPEFPDMHVTVTAMNFGSAPLAWTDNLDEILAALTDADLEVGQYRIFVDNSRDPLIAWTPDGWVPVSQIIKSTHVNRTVNFQYVGGSTIGWNYVKSNHSCSTTANGALDRGYTPHADDRNKRIRIYGRLDLHENTHGEGSGHYSATADVPSIMNSYITDGPISWVNDRIENVKRRWFGGIRINPFKKFWNIGRWA